MGARSAFYVFESNALYSSGVVKFFYDVISIFFAVSQELSQPAFTCSKFTIETQEQGVKYVQS